MSKRAASDRRAHLASSTFDERAFLGTPCPQKAAVLLLVGLGLTGWVDHLTGPDLWFGPIYLLIIGLTAWFLGRWQALAAGISALTISVCANGLMLYPAGTVAVFWNLAMRVGTVLAFIGLLDRVRQSLARECRLARTDPLTGALNRQAYFELAARSSVSDSWIMLAYADLDGLKRLNDE